MVCISVRAKIANAARASLALLGITMLDNGCAEAAFAEGALPTSASQEFLTTFPKVTKQLEINYPELSLRLDEEGEVRVAFHISASGKPERCSLVTSSGFPMLDEATCSAVTRMRFQGGNRGSTGPYSISVNWQLEDGETDSPFARRVPAPTRGVNVIKQGELPKGRRVNIGLYLNVNPEGRVTNCTVRWSSRIKALDDRACAIANDWRYLPLEGQSSIAPHQEIETFFFADPDATIKIDAATTEPNQH